MVTCVSGRDETDVEKLRSILAQLEFSMTIKEWDQKGVPFYQYLYVPEKHPITGIEFYEMEDERQMCTLYQVTCIMCVSMMYGPCMCIYVYACVYVCFSLCTC